MAQSFKSLASNVVGQALRAVKGQAWSNPLLYALVLGFIAAAMIVWHQTDRFSALAAAFFVSGASLACGAIGGFLFGIPRALNQSAQPTGAAGRSIAYRPNTNLEEVSDWLTKIVIALGLAELAKIPSIYQSLATYVAAAFPAPGIATSLAAALITYFSVLGFLILYLWTRLYLSGQFNRADTAARQSPAFLEGLTEALLYQPPPDGSEEAIEAADEYFKEYGDQNWRIWRSVACAYGQRYARLSQIERASETGIDVKTKALDALKRVINLNPRELEAMRSLWDPNRATPQEDDLVVFFGDDDFKKVFA